MKSLLVFAGLLMLVGCGDGSVNNVHQPITVTYKVDCLGTDTVSGLIAEHTTTYFNDGTETAECTMAGPLGSANGSETWFQDESGWLKSDCTVFSDIDSPSYGRWDFTVTGVPPGIFTGTAVYKDSTSQNNGYIIFMTCTKHTHPPVPSP